MNPKHVNPMLRSAIIVAACVSGFTAMAAGDYLFDILKEPAFHKAYVRMLEGERDLPSWLGQITGKENYVATPETGATIGATTYRLFHACKAHDCAGHELEVMFPLDGSRAFGMLVDGTHPPRWFGHPDSEQQAALRKGMQQ